MTERRKTERKPGTALLTITVEDASGRHREIHARLEDYSPGGIGIRCTAPLREGSLVSVHGQVEAPARHEFVHLPALVSWCIALSAGDYRAGLSFERASKSKPAADAHPAAAEVEDHYEVLQVNPKAEPETIHRVFRILAQRYHPDNQETGDSGRFRRVLEAYEILIDPAKRASYDVQRASTHEVRWKIFDQVDAAQGVEAEKRKRQGILAVLYAARIHRSEQPYLTIRDLEDLLNCPREHLEFSLWYLRERSWVARTDNGRYSITAGGVDCAEQVGAVEPRRSLLLPA